MKKSWVIIAALVAGLGILILIGLGSYNSFVQADETVKAQLGQLNNVYQQRADLIPNLVNTVQGAATAERQTLEAVVSARARATSVQLTPEALKDPQAFQNFQNAQNELSGALSRLLVTVEKYPDLKSQGNFTVLMSQLEGQESRVRQERNRYNEAVQSYNQMVRRFPGSIVAGLFGFTQYPYFQAAAGTENAPKVDFGTGGNTGATTAPGTPQSSETAPKAEQQPHGAVRPAPAR